MGAVFLKISLLLAMIVLTIVAGLTPIWVLKILRKKAATAQTLQKQQYVSLMLCLLTCFSGGVFLATCFLHLFPELTDHLTHMSHTYNFHFDYPLAELLSCIGFFVLFFLEEAVLYLIPSMAHGHSHRGHGHAHEPAEDFFAVASSLNGHERSGDKSQSELDSKKHDINDVSCHLLSHSFDSAKNENCHKLIEETVVTEVISRQTKNDNVDTSRKAIQFTTAASCNHSECPTTFLSLEIAEPERCEINCERVKENPPIRMKSRPHAHSHGTRSVTIVLAIAFHAIIEGLALGVQEDPPKIWAIFISLTVHKLIVAFSVGLQLGRTHAHNLHWVIISMVLISLMTPLGGVLGMLVQNAPIDGKTRDIVILICQGLAVGTFIYVTFFEVLIHERDNEHPNLLKLVMMLFGFAFIGFIRLLVNEHSHAAPSASDHSHAADHHH